MNLPVPDIMYFEDEGCKVTTDNRHYPIVFCNIDGAFTLAVVDFFFREWRKKLTDFAEGRRQAIVTIVCMTALQPPPATVRKAAGEWVATDASTKGLVGTCIVVSNPLLRGVITALVWIAGSENTTVFYHATIEAGIRGAISMLESAGHTPPILDPTDYALPPYKAT